MELVRMSKERAKVPEVVIGEPVTFKPMGVVWATEVTVPALLVIQAPLIAKQPEVISMPLERVEVEVSER